MKNKISLKIMAIVAFTGETFAKSTSMEQVSSFLTPIKKLNSFILTPLELLEPVYFEPTNFIDFSIALNLFWF